MPAGKHNLVIEQGATFGRRFTWSDSKGKPVNLTGYSARLHIREKVDSPNPVAVATTENGKIQLGGAAGTIMLMFTADETAAMSFKKGVYDLELENADGNVVRLLEGSVTLSPEVTR
jgi:hypothetical protein